MKDDAFSGKDPMLVFGFLQEIKSAYDACKIHEDAAMWLFKLLYRNPARVVVKAPVTLTKLAKFYY